jgi:thiamine-phosphate pyrophosphorylase
MNRPSADAAVLRILDANANRAGEGLRVVEEYARFVLDDAHLTTLCKQLRHDLAAALSELPLAERLAARDTMADVGTGVTTSSEFIRADAASVAAASLSRVQESLRAIEEYAKLLPPASSQPDREPLAQRIESLRYRTYTLARAIGISAESRARLAGVRLYVLIDGGASLDECERFANSLIEAGVQALQLRDNRLTDRELIARARRLREVTRGTDTLLIINDRADVAFAVQADGVHVGQDELAVKDVRSVVGTRILIGVSTHSIEQARAAVLDGADYLGVGPTFPSGTKQFNAFTGLELLHAVAAEITLPAFAIGGITLDNLAEVQQAGFERVAVSGAIAKAADPAQAAREFRRRLS